MIITAKERDWLENLKRQAMRDVQNEHQQAAYLQAMLGNQRFDYEQSKRRKGQQ